MHPELGGQQQTLTFKTPMNATSQRILGQICSPAVLSAPAEPVLAPAGRTFTLEHVVRPAGPARTEAYATVRIDTARIVPPAAV